MLFVEHSSGNKNNITFKTSLCVVRSSPLKSIAPFFYPLFEQSLNNHLIYRGEDYNAIKEYDSINSMYGFVTTVPHFSNTVLKKAIFALLIRYDTYRFLYSFYIKLKLCP